MSNPELLLGYVDRALEALAVRPRTGSWGQVSPEIEKAAQDAIVPLCSLARALDKAGKAEAALSLVQSVLDTEKVRNVRSIGASLLGLAFDMWPALFRRMLLRDQLWKKRVDVEKQIAEGVLSAADGNALLLQIDRNYEEQVLKSDGATDEENESWNFLFRELQRFFRYSQDFRTDVRNAIRLVSEAAITGTKAIQWSASDSTVTAHRVPVVLSPTQEAAPAEQFTLRARVVAFITDRAHALKRLPQWKEVKAAFPGELGSKATFYRKNPWYSTARAAIKKTLQHDGPQKGHMNAAEGEEAAHVDASVDAPDYHRDEAD